MSATGVRKGGTVLLYSSLGESDEVQMEDGDAIIRGVETRGWCVLEWLASLDEQTRRAATEARANVHACWRDN